MPYHNLSVTQSGEAGSSRWVNTLLFRASAMMPPGKRMIFNPEHAIPATAIDAPSPMTSSAGLVASVVVVEKVAGLVFHDFGDFKFPSCSSGLQISTISPLTLKPLRTSEQASLLSKPKLTPGTRSTGTGSLQDVRICQATQVSTLFTRTLYFLRLICISAKVYSVGS